MGIGYTDERGDFIPHSVALRIKTLVPRENEFDNKIYENADGE